ncbi:MAG: right-handed parallel beta-helix repeat-containing protein [Fibrobacterales bacterium]
MAHIVTGRYSVIDNNLPFLEIPMDRHAILLVITLLWVTHSFAVTSLYVSPFGHDSNSGSESAPFATLEAARDAVNVIKETATDTIAIYLEDGYYPLTQPFTLKPEDTGSSTAPIVYQALNRGRAIVTSAQNISGWTLYDAAKNIYKAAVTAGVSFRQLYANNYPQVRAREPNKTDNSTHGPFFKTISGDKETQHYVVHANDLKPWADLSGVEMVTHPHWYHMILHIDAVSYSGDQATVSFTSPDTEYAFNKPAYYYENNSYHLENALAFLDAPEEWYLDEENATLYYCIPQGIDINSLVLSYPTLPTLVSIEGTKEMPVTHISFKNITFTHTNWTVPNTRGASFTQGAQNIDPQNLGTTPGMIEVQFARNIEFKENIIRNSGREGIVFHRAVKQSTITGNVIQYISANGIVMDTYSNPFGPQIQDIADGCDSNRVANNTIRDIGLMYSNGIGVLLSFVDAVSVHNNDIAYGPYMGIQVGNQSRGKDFKFGNNKIFKNHIHHVMRVHDDGGGIYTLSLQRDTHVYDNYIHDITRGPWAMDYSVAAIYADNSSQYMTYENNVTQNCTEDLHENTNAGVKNNTWTNNKTSDASIEDAAGITAPYTHMRSHILHNVGLINTISESSSSEIPYPSSTNNDSLLSSALESFSSETPSSAFHESSTLHPSSSTVEDTFSSLHNSSESIAPLVMSTPYKNHTILPVVHTHHSQNIITAPVGQTQYAVYSITGEEIIPVTLIEQTDIYLPAHLPSGMLFILFK